MIKKPKDLLRRQSKDKELELGEGKLHAFMANTSIMHSSDYSNSFVSFLCHPSTKKSFTVASLKTMWLDCLLEGDSESI